MTTLRLSDADPILAYDVEAPMQEGEIVLIPYRVATVSCVPGELPSLLLQPVGETTTLDDDGVQRPAWFTVEALRAGEEAHE